MFSHHSSTKWRKLRGAPIRGGNGWFKFYSKAALIRVAGGGGGKKGGGGEVEGINSKAGDNLRIFCIIIYFIL